MTLEPPRTLRPPPPLPTWPPPPPRWPCTTDGHLTDRDGRCLYCDEETP